MTLTKEHLDYLHENEKKAREFLMKLASIPAPSNQENLRAQACADWLRSLGAEDVKLDSTGNVIYLVGSAEGPLTVFSAHSDVVFQDTDSLPVSVREGKIFCPGIGDDTANVVALLLAAGYLAQRKLVPKKGGLLFVIDAGEEGLGNLRGCRAVLKRFGRHVRRFYSFDLEYKHGINRAVGSRRYRITLRTRGGHSYHDFGTKSAIAAMAEIIAELYRIPLPEGGKTTYNVGMVRGGTSVNTIAEEARFLYEFRSDEERNLEYMEKHFREVLRRHEAEDLEIKVLPLGERPCGHGVDPSAEQRLVNQVRDCVREHCGFTPEFTAGSTDCNMPLSMGIPSVCIGCYEGGGEHTREEYVKIDSLFKGYEIAFDIVLSALEEKEA
jgi:acetylornithine deacetylase/succinyl-diaminopimelate desuccinylase-like protein